MDIKTISVAFVAIMVGAVAFGAMLPIFQDVTATEDTLTNTGYFRMSKINDLDEYTLNWDSANPRIVAVNGQNVSLDPVAGGIPFTLVGGNDIMIRYYVQSNNVRFWVQAFSTGNSVYSADSNNNQDMSISYSNGVITCDNGSGSQLTVSITDDLYAVKPDGDYILKKSNETAFVKADSKIIGLGTTALANNIDQRFVIEGTITDGFTAEYTPYDTMTMGAISVTASENTTIPYLGVYDFDKLSFTATYSDNDIDVVYSQVFVPYEITAEKAIHGDSGFNTIVNLIPLVIGMGLLLIAVWWFVVRKF